MKGATREYTLPDAAAFGTLRVFAMRLAPFLTSVVFAWCAGFAPACAGSSAETPDNKGASRGGAGSSSGGSTGSSADDGGGDDAASGDDGAQAGESGGGGDDASGGAGSSGGGGSSSGGAGDGAAAGGPYPAFVPTDPPQIITGGGPVLKSPKIVPVFFAGDDPTTTASLADFVKKVGQTNYWAAASTEYGVGAATGLDPVNLTAADNPSGTIADSAIQSFLAGKLNANDPAFVTPDANTVYILFYPAGVTITMNGGSTGTGSCVTFGGYHSSITLNASHHNMSVAYAVVPRCATAGTLKGLDVITGAASHELLEAATDPYPNANPAYAQVDARHFYWSSVFGGSEDGDMCATFPSSFTKFAELPDYTVQRTWSNVAEKAGQDPCVPAIPGSVYFNSMPVLKDSIATTLGAQTVNLVGVHIPVGSSQVVELDLFSTGPTTSPWSLSATDQARVNGQPANLGFSLDRVSGVNGDKVHLTITVMTAGRGNREIFIVGSTLGTQKNEWIGLVGN